ncbi:hypothetical protein ACH495_18780 [Micromonospora sp. NPDC018662]|uniref:hypothetical protein n=1 Tax=Micromonospora sp. NPDC018662 TaxID=3364238 RepID=UPI0037A243D7
MKVATSALLFIFTAAIGIAINKVTDNFTWVWAGILATLVLGGLAIQVTATKLQEEESGSAAGKESHTQQQKITANGGIIVNPVQNIVVGVSGRSLAFMTASILAVAIIVLLLAWLAVVANRRTSENINANERPHMSPGGETGNPRFTGPDPYLYVSFDDNIHLARKQTCPGLFGLCLGQPVQLALDSFGTTEIEGYPQSGGQSESTCHRWHPKRLDTVTVCDSSGAIESIRYDSLSSTNMTMAAPEGTVVEFPTTMPIQAPLITEGFHIAPFLSTYVPSEGEGIFSISWFLPQEAEGTPDAYLAIVARASGLFEIDARPCKGEDEIYYPYSDVLRTSKAATVTSVEVNTTQPETLRGPSICK